VKIFGMQAYELDRFQRENRSVRQEALRTTRAKLLNQPLMELVGAIGFCAVLVYGGEAVIMGSRTTGSFFAFLTSLYLCYAPFKGLGKANATMQQGLAAAEELFAILDTPPDPVEAHQPRQVAGLQRGLRAEGLGFGYGPGEPVIHALDLEIPRGSTVALVGPSGGGKSTIIDLFCRFYDPTAGRITFDGIDLRELSLASLRAQIALVDQNTFLFNETVANNIAYGQGIQGGVPAAAIQAAARAATCEAATRSRSIR
jgi:subfamily B ATP-binding cassette protein MsbA